MRNHCREERLGVSCRWAPSHNFLHRAVERMFGQVESELEKGPAFLQVATSGSRTAFGRPPLCLEAGMELADVMQKNQRSELPALLLCQR